MRTMSKFGLAGVRLGYMIGPTALVAEVDKVRPPYNVSVLNTEAALFALEHADVFAARDNLATIGFPGTDWHMLTVACICLFIGAMGKSAQFPLHVWLPDSMEGPTPISALIHAATMVAAGVFLVARVFPLMAGVGGHDTMAPGAGAIQSARPRFPNG